jgi:hypothetical protein
VNVRIDFEVHADTLDNATAKAQLVLAGFLGPDGNPNAWHITLRCTPSAETTTTGGEMILVDWLIEVEAVRGTL